MSQFRVISLKVIVFALLLTWGTWGAAAGAPHASAVGSTELQGSDLVSVLILMSDQPDVANLQSGSGSAPPGRNARHARISIELQKFAVEKQTPLLAVLEHGKAAGTIDSYEPFWLVNAVAVTGEREFVMDLAKRDDVRSIIVNLPLASIPTPHPDSESLPCEASRGTDDGIRAIGADSLWRLGLTGAGRLIATLDTGVDGDHSALSASYRGNHGYSAAECWFDPIFHEAYPHYEAGSVLPYWHGTSTMGLLVGKDDATGDTTGVAWGAQWISAMVVDVPGASLLEAFQWVADPDGDPNTVHDVPDVLNNSWGFQQYNLDCNSIFWNAIDNLEALGVICVFAAGDEGSQGLRNPANRATTPYNCFAVGALDAHDPAYPIWPASSRGPSNCDGVSIKPEVAGPGYQVRTTYLGGSYTLSTGTSFSTAHIAGAAALLRQYNPNATPEQVKQALMNSALDLGEPGEDNTYGMGLINLPGALSLMPEITEPQVYLDGLEYGQLSPGDTAVAVAILKNSGLGVANLSALLSSADPRVQILSGSAVFGDLAMGDSVSNQGDPFELVFAPEIVEGSVVTVELQLSADGGSYQGTTELYFRVGETLAKGIYTHVTDSCRFTISNFGTYGLADGSILSGGGVGFVYPEDGVNSLYQCGLLIGIDSNHVSDGISNLVYSVDQDFAVAAGGNLEVLSGKYSERTVTSSRFDDSAARNPIGVGVRQHTFAYEADSLANLIVLEYLFTNQSGADLSDVHAGLFFDWDFPFGIGNHDRTTYDFDRSLGYMWDETGGDYRGVILLGGHEPSGFLAIRNSITVYDGISEAEKYEFLTAGFGNSGTPTNYDQSCCISAGPLALGPAETDTLALAILAATSLEQLRQVASYARQAYGFAHCGDANGDGIANLTDAVYLIHYIFAGGAPSDPATAGDADCDGIVNITDVVHLIYYIFSDGELPCDADGDGMPDC